MSDLPDAPDDATWVKISGYHPECGSFGVKLPRNPEQPILDDVRAVAAALVEYLGRLPG